MARTELDLAALALVLVLVAPLAPAAAADDDYTPPAPKPPPSAEEMERRLDLTKLTVDWKGAGVLDALNEVQQKTGLRFVFDQDLADFAAARKVTFDGYSVSAREALRVLARAAPFTIEPDPAETAYRLRMEPAAPTLAALAEPHVSVSWKDAPVSRAISDIEKKTGLYIHLHETMRSRLRSRKITWEADGVTAREAIETLYVYPPPSIKGRIDAKPGMKVEIVYAGPPETRADLQFALDDRRFSASFDAAPLAEVAEALAKVLEAKVIVDPKLAAQAPKVTWSGADVPVRAALDGIAAAAGVAWKVEGPKVAFRPSGSSR